MVRTYLLWNAKMLRLFSFSISQKEHCSLDTKRPRGGGIFLNAFPRIHPKMHCALYSLYLIFKSLGFVSQTFCYLNILIHRAMISLIFWSTVQWYPYTDLIALILTHSVLIWAGEKVTLPVQRECQGRSQKV